QKHGRQFVICEAKYRVQWRAGKRSGKKRSEAESRTELVLVREKGLISGRPQHQSKARCWVKIFARLFPRRRHGESGSGSVCASAQRQFRKNFLLIKKNNLRAPIKKNLKIFAGFASPATAGRGTAVVGLSKIYH
ncbi:MAG: hypothetical protein AB1465_04045, partial [Patescibacteria group bacterium]